MSSVRDLATVLLTVTVARPGVSIVRRPVWSISAAAPLTAK